MIPLLLNKFALSEFFSTKQCPLNRSWSVLRICILFWGDFVTKLLKKGSFSVSAMQFGWGTYQFFRRSVRSRPVWPRSRQCPFRTRAWPARPRSCWDAADIHFQNCSRRCSSSTHPERTFCLCQPLPSTTITGGTQNQSHLALTSSQAWTTKIQATWISSSWFYAFWPIWQVP